MEARFWRRGRATALIAVQIRGFVENVVGRGEGGINCIGIFNNHQLHCEKHEFKCAHKNSQEIKTVWHLNKRLRTLTDGAMGKTVVRLWSNSSAGWRGQGNEDRTIWWHGCQLGILMAVGCGAGGCGQAFWGWLKHLFWIHADQMVCPVSVDGQWVLFGGWSSFAHD